MLIFETLLKNYHLSRNYCEEFISYSITIKHFKGRNKTARGKCFTNKRSAEIIFYGEAVELNTIVHELYHLAFQIQLHFQLDEEQCAQLSGDLFEDIIATFLSKGYSYTMKNEGMFNMEINGLVLHKSNL